MMHLNAEHCTAEHLYATFVNLLNDHHIPVNNVIGIGSDVASVMVDKYNFFPIKNFTKQYICNCNQKYGYPSCTRRSSKIYLSCSFKKCAQFEEMHVDKKNELHLYKNVCRESWMF